jgi:hypothetical protein
LDADPISDCKDCEKLSVIDVEPTLTGPDKATATLAFNNSVDRIVMTSQMVSSNGQWRVDDIGTGGMPSLRRYLESGLAKETAGP